MRWRDLDVERVRAATLLWKEMNRVLWAFQGLLAGLFVFAGAFKLFGPMEQMTQQMSLPLPLLRFVGAAEILGALGLILPRAVPSKSWLIPLAAAGLVLVMIGATVLSAMAGGWKMALFPAGTGLLAAFVSWGRWKVAP